MELQFILLWRGQFQYKKYFLKNGRQVSDSIVEELHNVALSLWQEIVPASGVQKSRWPQGCSKETGIFFFADQIQLIGACWTPFLFVFNWNFFQFFLLSTYGLRRDIPFFHRQCSHSLPFNQNTHLKWCHGNFLHPALHWEPDASRSFTNSNTFFLE